MRITYLLLGLGVGFSLFHGLAMPSASASEPAKPPNTAANQDTFDYSEVTYRDVLKKYLAQLKEQQKQRQEAPSGGDQAEETLSPECAAFAEQPDADIGDVMAAGCEPTLAQMSALMNNPVGNVAILLTQFDFTQVENPSNPGTTAFINTYTGIAQFPKGLNKEWNLINRIVWTAPSVPLSQSKIDDFSPASLRNLSLGAGRSFLPPAGSPPSPIDLFSGRTTGLGDMYYVGLFSPKKPPKLGNGSLLWGLGFDVGIPTASRDLVGTGKWTAGPAALLAYLGPKWKVGFLGQHYWDFAGDPARDPVNLTNLQYFIYYSLDPVTSIGVGPNIIVNWEQEAGNKWTVPVGIGINRTFQFGKIPVRIGLEAHYSAIRPDNVAGAEWNYRLFIIPAVPAALFKWMQ